MADAPTTTIVPFASLPDCASNCGPLYDANGGCVPPAAPEGTEESYEQCFCNYAPLQAIANDPPADVCNGVCPVDGSDYDSLRDWYTDLCSDVVGGVQGIDQDESDSSSSGRGGGGGSWLDNHWRWVVMIVVIFVGIVTIWVGACIWRRKYLKKKDRMHELGKHPTGTHSGPWAPGASGVNMLQGTANGAARPDLDEKKAKKKKWLVRERT